MKRRIRYYSDNTVSVEQMYKRGWPWVELARRPIDKVEELLTLYPEAKRRDRGIVFTREEDDNEKANNSRGAA